MPVCPCVSSMCDGRVGQYRGATPPPPLHKKHLSATVPSHPRGDLPQVTVPSPPPPPPAYYARDARHEPTLGRGLHVLGGRSLAELGVSVLKAR